MPGGRICSQLWSMMLMLRRRHTVQIDTEAASKGDSMDQIIKTNLQFILDAIARNTVYLQRHRVWIAGLHDVIRDGGDMQAALAAHPAFQQDYEPSLKSFELQLENIAARKAAIEQDF
jgi:hypothetical protein